MSSLYSSLTPAADGFMLLTQDEVLECVQEGSDPAKIEAMMQYDEAVEAGDFVLHLLRSLHADPLVVAYLDLVLDSLIDPCPPLSSHSPLIDYDEILAIQKREYQGHLTRLQVKPDAVWQRCGLEEIVSRVRSVQQESTH